MNLKTLFVLGWAAVIGAASLGGCGGEPDAAPVVVDKKEPVAKTQQSDSTSAADRVSQFEAYTNAACQGTDISGTVAGPNFIGRVGPDAPDWYSIHVEAGSILNVEVRGLYGFDPWAAIMCKPSSGGTWISADSNDLSDSAGMRGKNCNLPSKRNYYAPKMARTDSKVYIRPSYDSDCVVIISSSDAWHDFHYGSYSICRFSSAMNDTIDVSQLPGLFALPGAPDLMRGAYVANVSKDLTPYSNQKRGCTDARSFKAGGAVALPLVPASSSTPAPNIPTCHDDCIGVPMPTNCSCPPGQEWCAAAQQCFRELPLTCPSRYDRPAGSCDCCGAVDTDINGFEYCFPGACHPEVTWYEFSCQCQKAGTSCTSNDQCCGEHCEIPGGATTGTCRCLNSGEKCHVGRDCCSWTSGETTSSCVAALVTGGYYGQCK